MCTPMCTDIYAACALVSRHSACSIPPQGNPGGSKPMSGEGGLLPGAGPGTQDQESRWKQYLEDERIALFLQNEEFMKELQRNRDFLLALERGGTLCRGSAATSPQLKKGIAVAYSLGARGGGRELEAMGGH